MGGGGSWALHITAAPRSVAESPCPQGLLTPIPSRANPEPTFHVRPAAPLPSRAAWSKGSPFTGSPRAPRSLISPTQDGLETLVSPAPSRQPVTVNNAFYCRVQTPAPKDNKQGVPGRPAMISASMSPAPGDAGISPRASDPAGRWAGISPRMPVPAGWWPMAARFVDIGR